MDKNSRKLPGEVYTKEQINLILKFISKNCPTGIRNRAILAILYGIIGFMFGGAYASIGAVAMDITNPRVAASQYSIFMALLNIGEVGIGNGLAGIMLDTLGYTRVFLYSGLFYGVAILIIYLLKLKKPKNKTWFEINIESISNL